MADKQTPAKTRKVRTSKAPKDETKAAKFVRLGEQRVTRAVKVLRGIGKLGGAGYERAAEQHAAIVTLLQKEVDAVNAALNPTKQVTEKAGAVIKL